MDRRTIAAVVLSLAIYYSWVVYRGATAPPPPEVTEAPTAPAPDVIPVPVPVPTPVPDIDAPPARQIPFAACGFQGVVSTAGGGLSDVTLDHWTGPYLVTPLYTWVMDLVIGEGGPWKPYGNDPGPAILVSEDGEAFSAGAGTGGPPVSFAVVEEAAGRIVLAGRAANGIDVHRTLEEVREGETCTLRSTVTWRNPTADAIAGGTWVAMHDVVPESHSRYGSQRQPLVVVNGSLTYGGPTGAGCVREGTQLGPETPRIPLEGALTWFGLSDRYFGIYALPRETGSAATLTREVRGDKSLDGTVVGDERPLGPGEERQASYVLYGGPNQIEALSAVDPSLTKAVDLGWFAFFAWPLLWLLRKFHGFLGNWGLAIILLTFCVKLLFFRMTQTSFKAMRRMQAIQPLLNEVRQKYAADPQEMNRRTMALMAEHQVNPLSGCLPQLVQIPVWLALYNALLTSVELYHTRFLYLRDLSEPDPYLVLPVAITFLMWVQQQLSTPTNLDPVQQQVMRWMPLIFGLLFFAFPSGLAVYVFVNVALSIGQQWLINRSADPPQASPTASPAPGGAIG